VPGALIEGLLIVLLVAAPLPLGSVAPWARAVLFLGACLLLCLWVLRSSLLGRIEVVRTPAWFFAAAYLVILSLQIVPLPQALLAGLSPKTHALFAWLVPGFPERAGMRPVSLCPYATVHEICRILTFAMVLFVFLNHYRHRRQVARALWALVAVGLFQALYGLAEKFSGSPKIFWIVPLDRVSVHGTYFNRNHFAGLMEMLTPTVFGFFLASLASQPRSWKSSQRSLFQRIEQALSGGRAYRNLLLGMVVAAMFLAGVLSLSRGGTGGLLVGFLVLYGFTRAGGQRRAGTARVFVFVVLAALGLLFYRGVDGVFSRFELLAGENSSWEGRRELRRAGMRMFGDFPVLGVGGGAFRYAFPTYQPERYGDLAARYVHNDWLQVACETGVLGAVAAYAGIALFLAGLLRRVRRREDPYCRLIFGGAFGGVVAMLFHSLVDFNLYMVSANGLVFTVLLGVCHAAAHMKGRSRNSSETFRVRAVEMRGPALRIGLPAAALAACTALSIVPVRSGLADIAFNRYRTWTEGRQELYFFWKCRAPDREAARGDLARAAALQPGSPDYRFALGIDRVESIREKVLDEARQRARRVYRQGASSPGADFGSAAVAPAPAAGRDALKEEAAPAEEASQGFRDLVAALSDPARRGMREEIRAALEQAEGSFRKAMRIAPTVPWYRMTLAMAYADLLAPGPCLEAKRPEVDRLVEEALALAPSRPAVLFPAARYRARRILEDGRRLDSEREEDRRVLDMFRSVLEMEPGAYGLSAYEFLVDEAGAEPGVLFRITPGTLASQRRLLGFLGSRGMWPEALEAADNVLAILGFDPGGSAVPDLRPGSVEFSLGLATTRQQIRMLQAAGRPGPWRIAEERYRSLLGIPCEGLLETASRYAGLGRFAEAAKACDDCLEMDWNRLEALLMRAEIERLPGARRGGEARPARLPQEVMRLAGVWAGPDKAACERLRGLLSGPAPETPVERLEAGLAEAVTARDCGDPQEAERTLRALLGADAGPFLHWHQRHLLHYHLGRSMEMSGAPREEAAGEYSEALKLAPSHRPSLERLVELGMGEWEPAGAEGQGSPTVSERLEMLTPEEIWGIDLEGKVAFLGITLGGARQGASGLSALYYWEVASDLNPTDYLVAYRYLGPDGTILHTEWRALFPDPKGYGRNLDGGIGTVLVHRQDLPFPHEVVGEVRILALRKQQGKLVHQPFRSVTGDRWLVLGLPAGPKKNEEKG
jgi:O-antigen ligase/tetratricopeptide (TPR) repeat protein